MNKNCTHPVSAARLCKLTAQDYRASRLHRAGACCPPNSVDTPAVATLLLKHRPDLITTTDADGGVPPSGQDSAEAERLAKDLEKLGPTFVKLGQVLSTRADLLPPAYLEALSRLQDDVEPVPLCRCAEDDRRRPERARSRRRFSTFDHEPLASASLGQVHRATLRDGRAVAVKVQRPGIMEQALADLTVLDEIAAFIDHHTKVGRRYEFAPMIREFRKALMDELDYEVEANHLRTLKRNLAEFERIVRARAGRQLRQPSAS